MGNDQSTTISINLERTNSFYFSDETIRGSANINITNEKLEADEIYITLTGEVGYTTTRTVTRDDRQQTVTDHHNVSFYSVEMILAQPSPGQKTLTFNHGQYSWPFQFPLPNYLPPTINHFQSYPHVRYSLNAIIDKPWYKPNITLKQYITIYPRVNLLQNPQCLLSTIFTNQNRKEITLKGTLNKIGYVPGETINVTLEIDNPRNILIKRIDCSMFQSYEIGRNTRGNSIMQATLPNIINLNNPQIRKKFSISIPLELIPPSYHFQGTTGKCTLVHIHYFLRFDVKVQGIFTNFNADIPITLGTDPRPDLNQQQTFNPLAFSYSINPQESMYNDGGDDDNAPPPSYDSVFSNVK